jgi:hypothetical protein
MLPSPEATAAYLRKVQAWQEQYGEYTRCPITDLLIPKAPAVNLEWRMKTRNAARADTGLQRDLRAACAASYFYWVNLFGFTYHQKWVNVLGEEMAVTGDAAHVPFLTWKIQDDAAASILACIRQGEDALIDKTRDMGASWLVVSIFQHMFQFVPNSTFLELSRKEMYVDQRGNMDSLIEKHRYMLRMQPVWLRPKKIRDNNMMLENQDNGSSIIGESTNENAGQAGRKTAILIDEAARIKNLEAIDLATNDTAACRIFNSTVNGPATWYTRVFRDMQASRRSGTIIELPWEAHPLKGKGLHVIDVPITPKYPVGKKAVSPWYEREEKSRSSRDLAQNIDRDHGKSGDVFFDPAEIEQHRTLFQSEPAFTGNIRFDDDLTEEAKKFVLLRNEVEEVRFVEGGIKRAWRLWCPLVNGRPIQTHSYAFGVDVSLGSGASNSVISVFDHDANMKIGEFADAFTTPEDLAWLACLAGVWFGGRSGRPVLCWEVNGPGVIFGKKVMQIGYAPIYYHEVEGTKSHKVTEKYGWHSSAARKELLLGEYRDALKNARYINPSKESLDEAIDYVYNEKGVLVPASSKAEAGGAAATHGDRVVADALCELGRKLLPKVEAEKAKAPAGSYAQLRDAYRRRKGKESDVWLQ